MSAYEPVTITSVEEREKFWRITDSTGTRYATRSMFVAALCDRYRALGTTVFISAESGWYYRQIRNVVPYEEHQRIVAERKEQRA